MDLMTTTLFAEFFQLNFFCIITLILHRGVIPILALSAR